MNKSDNIVILILIAILLVIVFIEGCCSTVSYNSGKCSLCGGTYKFKETVGHRYGTNYIYICDKCGNLIESTLYFKED